MTLKRSLQIAAVGVIMFGVGFAIGATQSNETGPINTTAAVLGTAGAAVAAVGVLLTAIVLLRRT